METQELQKTGGFGNVVKWEQTVKTPMPENPDGSGFTTEENRKVIYEMAEYYVQVSKVSNRGWSVKRYDADGLDTLVNGYFEDEQAAHEKARELVEEVSLENSAPQQ